MILISAVSEMCFASEIIEVVSNGQFVEALDVLKHKIQTKLDV